LKSTINRLISKIEEQGWKGQIIPVSHLSDLRELIYDRYEKGLIDETFFRDQLSFLSFDPPEDLPDACSIIIIAVPTPQMRIFFNWKSKLVPVVVPPTYINYTPRTENTRKFVADWLQSDGYRLAKAKLPLKTIAVHSGLAEYGRNNICYVNGMGSFLQLVGAFSDLPCDYDSWQEAKMLDQCESCVACLQHCPTRAIVNDRFIIHAELCLTYHNEALGDFPEWINPFWHHCLVGCMRCQNICPENKSVNKWFEDRVEFSEPETALLVKHVPFEQLPPETINKIDSLEISENYQSLCRNLSMIIGQENIKN
jgi:epoxyqueuosine reductase